MKKDLTAPPSQGKVERARELLAQIFYTFYPFLIASPILHTLGCVPDSTDLSETDAKVSVGFLRRLIESSGQGTDGEEVRVFLQDVIDAMNGDGPAFKWRDDSDSDALDYLGMKAEHLLRALPLPVSADGRDKVIEECATVASQYPTPAALAIAANIRSLKSKQPSDTGTEK